MEPFAALAALVGSALPLDVFALERALGAMLTSVLFVNKSALLEEGSNETEEVVEYCERALETGSSCSRTHRPSGVPLSDQAPRRRSLGLRPRL